MKKTSIILLLFLLIAGAGRGDDRIAWIDVEHVNDLLVVKGFMNNTTDKKQTISYLLTSERTGRYGTVLSSQSGEQIVEPSDTTLLSRTSFTIAKGDSCILRLDVFESDTMVATDRIIFTFGDNEGE